MSLTQLTSDGCEPKGKTGADRASGLAFGSSPDDPTRPDPRGVYAHVPFCFHKCHYCDFYSVVDRQDRQGPFVDRFVDDLSAARPMLGRPLETIFVGGGTPTLLEPELLGRVARALADLGLAADYEYTFEANPETVTAEGLDALASAGVNRLSVGAQSFDHRHLETLERHHDPARVERAVGLARAAGIGNLNLDLIFGIPGQTADDWSRDLDCALALEPDHLSCYALTYEPGTPLTARRDRGEVRATAPDLEAGMYEMTIARLAAAGYEHYEISNWARPGARCRHNLLYWTNGQWWPIGPAACGHAGGWRWRNVPGLAPYLAGRGLPPITDAERLDEDRAHRRDLHARSSARRGDRTGPGR